LFLGQEGLLGTAVIASNSNLVIAIALASLVIALAAIWWFRGRAQVRSPEGEHRRTDMARLLGNALMVGGLLLTVAAGYVYVSEMTDSSRSLPRPVALQSAGGSVSSVSAPVPTATATPTAVPTAEATVAPTAPPPMAQVTETATAEATVTEATASPTPEPTSTPEPPEPIATPKPQVVNAPATARGKLPDRMVIKSLGVDSKVQEMGTYFLNGEWHWQTSPWAIAYYGVTGAVGQNGNAVFSGHVSTRNYGNVFKDLYKMELGDKVEVFVGSEKFNYVVDEIRLVAPTDTSVMDPTPDPVITLITCAGDWIESERIYTERLIVRATMEQ
jgi:LPXTG-site transpeptidase (sortase) family protein